MDAKDKRINDLETILREVYESAMKLKFPGNSEDDTMLFVLRLRAAADLLGIPKWPIQEKKK